MLSPILLWCMGTMILANLAPNFPIYVSQVPLVVRLPVMWVKFRLPTGRQQGTEECSGLVAEATMEVGPVVG